MSAIETVPEWVKIVQQRSILWGWDLYAIAHIKVPVDLFTIFRGGWHWNKLLAGAQYSILVWWN